MTGKEIDYIRQADEEGWLSGNGKFTKKCQDALINHIKCSSALLTHTCTAALEMAALLADIQPGDEIIMPSYTFVTTATPFVLRGGVPVFVDIRPDTLNIDENKISAAITSKTKAIVPVHYAGVSCEMDVIMAIAKEHNLLVIEDAAHGILSRYKDHAVGSIGHMAVLSFHETKNITSGEGGALLINDSRFYDRAKVIAEKGTNRSRFLSGEVDKYTWIDVGSSYYPAELVAAFLWAQMESVQEITKKRLNIWNSYHLALERLEKNGSLRRPIVPDYCIHNAHMYYVLLDEAKKRPLFIQHLHQKDITTVFHYVPLHLSPAGKKYGRVHGGKLEITEDISERLVRFPLWIGIEKYLDEVIQNIMLEIDQLSRKEFLIG